MSMTLEQQIEAWIAAAPSDLQPTLRQWQPRLAAIARSFGQEQCWLAANDQGQFSTAIVSPPESDQQFRLLDVYASAASVETDAGEQVVEASTFDVVALLLTGGLDLVRWFPADPEADPRLLQRQQLLRLLNLGAQTA